jgi:hypothetical protein
VAIGRGSRRQEPDEGCYARLGSIRPRHSNQHGLELETKLKAHCCVGLFLSFLRLQRALMAALAASTSKPMIEPKSTKTSVKAKTA